MPRLFPYLGISWCWCRLGYGAVRRPGYPSMPPFRSRAELNTVNCSFATTRLIHYYSNCYYRLFTQALPQSCPCPYTIPARGETAPNHREGGMSIPGRVIQGLPLRHQGRRNPPKSITATKRAIRRTELEASTQRNTRTRIATREADRGRSLPKSATMKMTVILTADPGENHRRNTMRATVIRMTDIERNQRRSVTRIKARVAVTAVATATLPDARLQSRKKTSQGIIGLGLPTRIRQNSHAKAITSNHPSLSMNVSAARADMAAMHHPMTMIIQDRATMLVKQATAATKE